jgi:hypothetical protein
MRQKGRAIVMVIREREKEEEEGLGDWEGMLLARSLGKC